MDGDRVLVVDDEASLRFVLSALLTRLGCSVTCAESGEDAVRALEGGTFALALLDIVLPGMNGIDVLREIKSRSPGTEVVMMTSHASLETAIDAIRSGAYDYLHKPFEIDEAAATVHRALEKSRLVRHNRELVAARERQNRDLHSMVQRLRALHSAGVGLSTLSTEQDAIALFVDIVVQELDAGGVSVLLGEGVGESLRVVASRGAGVTGGAGAALAGLAGRVLEADDVVLVIESSGEATSAPAEPGTLDEPPPGARTRLGVPIKSLGQVLGVVEVVNREGDRPFGPDEGSFVEGLSGQLAVAIERARQTERLQNSIGLLKAAHERLLASERLNALGEMAAGVAHDFNNILNGILGRSQLLMVALADSAPDPARLSASVETIETLAHQGADAVRRIQDSARTRKERPADDVDPNAVVRLAAELMRPHLDADREGGRSIQVQYELLAVRHTTGNTLELVQALSNIVFNAIDAMPAGGTLTFRTADDDEWVRLEVSDTGVGMDADLRGKLFVPFHTTKPDGHGLGLSIVYGIVSRMGGRIDVQSEPGRGSTFALRMPVRSADAPAGANGADTGPSLVCVARILVIDDEPYNRDFCVEGLGLDGHDVVACENGAAGLAAFDAGAFDLVLTDLSMPGMSGWEVAAAVKQRRPDVPVLMLSGWGAQYEESHAREAGVDCLLAKPIDLDVLLRTVRAALHTDAQRPDSGRAAA